MSAIAVKAREIIARERASLRREGADDGPAWCARGTDRDVAEGIWRCMVEEGALALPDDVVIELLASFIADIREGERLKRVQS